MTWSAEEGRVLLFVELQKLLSDLNRARNIQNQIILVERPHIVGQFYSKLNLYQSK